MSLNASNHGAELLMRSEAELNGEQVPVYTVCEFKQRGSCKDNGLISNNHLRPALFSSFSMLTQHRSLFVAGFQVVCVRVCVCRPIWHVCHHLYVVRCFYHLDWPRTRFSHTFICHLCNFYREQKQTKQSNISGESLPSGNFQTELETEFLMDLLLCGSELQGEGR